LKTFKAAGIRAEVDLASERLNKKIRNAQLSKTPYMIILGEKELEAKNLSVRLRSGENVNGIPTEEFVKNVADLTASRSNALWPVPLPPPTRE
jgi:threonyl-tRNA synthetase